MRVVRLETQPVRLTLAEPYAIAYESYDHAENVLVTVVTDSGPPGLGLAAPDEHVTGEDAASVLVAIDGIAGPILKGADPLRPGALVERLAAAGMGPTALAGVDMALFDILGRRAGLPVWRLLGGYRESMPTSITIGIMPPEDAARRAREFADRGFFRLKLKGGRDPEQDAETVARVRETVGPDVGICFDANQGFTAAALGRFTRLTAAAGLEFIEQPLPRGAALPARPRGDTPIMADEDLLTPDDARSLAAAGTWDLFNLKLMKHGGIWAAGRLGAMAECHGIGLMVGCMDEGALGIAAGLALALSRPGMRYADLDGHLDIVNDPTAGAVRIENGVIHPSNLPGLGLERFGPI